MVNNRIGKVNAELQKNIYEILVTKVKDPRLTEMFTITQVSVDKELKKASKRGDFAKLKSRTSLSIKITGGISSMQAEILLFASIIFILARPCPATQTNPAINKVENAFFIIPPTIGLQLCFSNTPEVFNF